MTLRASDQGTPQQVATQNITITVLNPLAVSSTRMPDAVLGVPYSGTPSVKGGTPPYTWSPGESGWFPTWASINANTGEITGTPSYWGNTALKVYVRDSAVPPKTVSAILGFMISQPLSVDGTVRNGTLGVPYSTTLSVRGGYGTRTPSISEGALPPGLTFAVNNYGEIQISGTPTQPGDYVSTLRVSDTATPPQVLNRTLTITIDKALTILTTDLPPAVKGRAYSSTPVIVNGVPPFSWQGSNLPTGLSMNNFTGEITGRPSFPGYFFPIVMVADSSSPVQTIYKNVNLNIYDTLSVSCTDCTITGRLNESLNGMAYATGGVPPLTWTKLSGSLPAGITFSSSGALEGIPTQTGTFPLQLHVEDSANPPQTLDKLYTIVVLPPLPFIQTSALPGGIIANPYAAKLIAAKGTPPYSFAITSGSLPPGINLATNGDITGSPSAAGDFDFIVTVTDSASPAQSTNRDFRISVRPVALGRNDDLAHATVVGNGDTEASISPYSDPIDIPNPDTDFFKILAPSGTTVTVEAVGYPIYSFTANGLSPVLELVDANGIRLQTCRNPEDDAPSAPIIRDTTPDAFDDVCVNHIGSDDWIKSHLDIQVPGTAGQTVAIYAHVLDFRGDARPDFTYILRVSGAVDPLRITTTSLKPGSIGMSYSATITATGGTGMLKFSVASGALPPGLTLSDGGLISGAPTAEGTASFTVQVSDSGNPAQVARQAFSVPVAQPVLITTADVPHVTTGVPYSYQITTSGGTPPLGWGFMSITLWPCCIGFEKGLLSGTTNAPGTYTGRVSVGDASGNYDVKIITMVVDVGPMSISTKTLPDARVGSPYSTSLKVLGGDGKYQWTLVSGTLPAGLSLATTGAITGYPSQSGVFTFTVQVSDASGQTPAQQTLTLAVQP